MRFRPIAYLGAGVAILCIWQFLVHEYLSRDHALVLEQTTEAEAQLADFRMTVAQLPDFLARSKSLEASMLDLQSSLYAKGDILRLLGKIDDQARAHGLKINEITPPVGELLALNSAANNPSEPQFLNITLRLEGDYVGFGKFVTDLEQAKYFRGINACRINGSPSQNVKIDFSVGFRALLGSTEVPE
jgi:Tfp pilus assembly protein PilO